MARAIRRFFNDLLLRQKIYAILWLSLIPLSLAAMAGLAGVTRSYSEMLYRNIAAQLSYSAEAISTQIQNIEMMSYMLYTHETVQENMPLLASGDDVRQSGAARELFSLLLNYQERFSTSHISYVSLFSGESVVSSNVSVSQQIPQRIHDAVRAAARRAQGEPVWVGAYNGNRGLYLCREIGKLRSSPRERIGEEVVCIDVASMVRDATHFSGQYEHADFLLLNGDKVIFHSDGLSDMQAARVQSELDRDYRVLELDGHSYFAVRGLIPRSEWDYICLVSYDAIARHLWEAQFNYGLILALCALMIVLLASLAIGSLDSQFHRLIDKMTAIGNNEWPSPDASGDYSDRRDEIGMLNRNFDQMTAQLHDLIQANYVNELLKKEAQLKALENQINPHFLYNTLESINWRAKALGAEDISTMAQSLGALLRVTLSEGSEPFTLRRELELIRSYMSIMTFRFEERLNFSIDVPDELLALPFPKLTLQPLVENAIRYGLEENTEGCEIRIAARREGGDLRITVRNSGSAFEDRLLEKLRAQELPTHGHGIGLLNIDRRLALAYGEHYGLTLYNENDEAVACVVVPVEPAEKEESLC